jgi:hypothetical protein
MKRVREYVACLVAWKYLPSPLPLFPPPTGMARCCAPPPAPPPSWKKKVTNTKVSYQLHQEVKREVRGLGEFLLCPPSIFYFFHKNPVKDFCLEGSRWCLSLSVVVWLCSGRWLVGPCRTRNKLFYLTRPQLALLKSLLCSDRWIGPEAGAY